MADRMANMLTRRRVVAVIVVLVSLAVVWTIYSAWRTERDLHRAEQSVGDLRVAVETGDAQAQDAAVADLTDAASSAKGRTDGLWWGALTHLPVYGDDVAGVEALSASLDTLATSAVEPLVATIASLDDVTADGRVDTAAVEALEAPVSQAREALQTATSLVQGQKSDGFVDALRTRYVDYVDQIVDLERGLASAQTAVELLPDMLGASGSRDYLLVFQNNAEIRATGGVPGSWAQVHAGAGRLTIREQGSAGDFPQFARSVTPLTAEEIAVYGQEIGRFFQDPGFTPDFPRAAQIMDAFWQVDHADTPLDGVVALDPVALSYLLRGTGPVEAAGVSITADNAVQLLLNQVYINEPDPAKQDVFFQAAAKTIFDATTSDLASPIDFVEGLVKAGREGRFLVAPFDSDEAVELAGSRVEGAVPAGEDATPSVYIGLNDGTGSKMSYYLRYSAEVEARSCFDGTQRLDGRLTLAQTVSPADTRVLPDYITGGGVYGTAPGNQFVFARIYGPIGGTVDNVRLDGMPLNPATGESIAGRPVSTLAIELSSIRDAVVTWQMTTGGGQNDGGLVGVTPSVVPGDGNSTFASACAQGSS